MSNYEVFYFEVPENAGGGRWSLTPGWYAMLFDGPAGPFDSQDEAKTFVVECYPLEALAGAAE